MKFKYNVVVKKGCDITNIEKVLVSKTGDDVIPTRPVEINCPLMMSKRVTSFFLTDDEAASLRSHKDVQSVELDISERDDVKVSPAYIQTGDFRKGSFDSVDKSTLQNWGLKRHGTKDKSTYDAFGETADSPNDVNNHNLLGEGVDVIIMDTGIHADHPDFHDENGLSRIQKINWLDVFKKAVPLRHNKYEGTYVLAHEDKYYYQDQVGPHGTHVASLCCGQKHGLAKKSHIYLAKIDMGNPFYQMDTLDWFDIIIYWHKNKNNTRPTVVNMSWTLNEFGINYDEITGGAFTDTADSTPSGWTRTSQTDETIANSYNILINDSYYTNDINHRRLYLDEAYNALVDEMLEAGIHVVTAAGNYGQRILKEDHPEHGNYLYFTAQVEQHFGSDVTKSGTWFYNQPGSPYSADAIHVGAISNNDSTLSVDQRIENIASFSTKGPAVDIFAAGLNCMSATNDLSSNKYNYGSNTDFHQAFFSGTSAAAPQVAGAAAVYLSAQPDLSPADLKAKILAEADTTAIYMQNTGSYTDYGFTADSPNVLLYNKHTSDVSINTTNISMTNCNIGTNYKLTSEFGFDTEFFNEYKGIKPYLTGNQFSNNNAQSIYKNSILNGFFYTTQYVHGTQTYTYTITLKFAGNAVSNTGWSKLEWANYGSDDPSRNSYFVFLRKDAVYDPIEKSFTWQQVYNRVNSPENQIKPLNSTNRIGII